MIDEKGSREEEYKFSDIDNADAMYSAPTQTREPQPADMLRRNVMLAVAAVALIFAFYKLSGMFVGGDTKKVDKQGTQMQSSALASLASLPAAATEHDFKQLPALETEQPQPSTPAPAVVSHDSITAVHTSEKAATLAPPAPASSFNEPAVATKVSDSELQNIKNEIETNFKQQNASSQNQVQTLNQEVTDLRKQLVDIKAAMVKVQAQLAAMEEKAQTRATGIPPVAKTVKPVAIHKHTYKRPTREFTMSDMPRVRSTDYYIEGIIQGRAWLIDRNGATLTVSVGTKLPNGGTVTAIEQATGRVVTSTGAVIKFPPGG